MLIEQPPFFYRMFFPKTIWRINPSEKSVYLTFDDGPIPDITPWVLGILDKYNIKATFFCVGDNVRKYPEIFQEVLNRGHRVGNHTYHHIQGLCSYTNRYKKNVELADQLIQSDLFRPPHGHLGLLQILFLMRKYKIIMWDVVTRDYSWRLNSDQVFENVKKYTRNGSVIVFHDSLKAEPRLKGSLERSIQWLQEQGYTFKLI